MKALLTIFVVFLLSGCVSLKVTDKTTDSKNIVQTTSWNSKWTNNYGYISRLYPSENKVYFKLYDGRTSMAPKRGYYFIPMEHPNYRSMVDLLYMAAEKKWKIYVKTKNKLSPEGFAEAEYFVVDPPHAM